MTSFEDELDELIPRSDAGIALSRMPAAERLPKYAPNSLKLGPDLPEDVKAEIRKIGTRDA
jgi:hypothetical protein